MSMIDRTRGLIPWLATHTAAHDRDRALTPAVVDVLRADGYLQLLLPAALGGHAVAPSTYVEIVAGLAEGDAATAWVVMTASTSTLLASYLPRSTGESIWNRSEPTPLLAGVFAPSGTATVDGDRVRLTGRWAYGSGCRHAAWVAVGALTGTPPRHVVCVLPLAAPGVRIDDTWDPIGLAGTGSHDLVIDDATLSNAAMVSVFEQTPWPDEPLARVPLFGLLALGVAGVGLGIARGALTELGAVLRATRGTGPSSTALASYAGLATRLRAAHALVIDVADRAYALAMTGPPSSELRGELRLAAAHAAAESTAITRACFHLAGASSIRRGSRLARALADAEVMLSHRMVADRILPAAARAVLGLGPVAPDL
jgi:indole-3-acetate monooxygenase